MRGDANSYVPGISVRLRKQRCRGSRKPNGR